MVRNGSYSTGRNSGDRIFIRQILQGWWHLFLRAAAAIVTVTAAITERQAVAVAATVRFIATVAVAVAVTIPSYPHSGLQCATQCSIFIVQN